jgi:hypothetical protein
VTAVTFLTFWRFDVDVLTLTFLLRLDEHPTSAKDGVLGKGKSLGNPQRRHANNRFRL